MTMTYLALPKKLKRAAAIRAVKSSIRKWVDIAAGRRIDKGEEDCACCKLAMRLSNSCDCFLCPVYIDSRSCCNGNYSGWIAVARRKFESSYRLLPEEPKSRKEAIKAAKAMAAYLRRLLKRLHIKKGKTCKS